MNAICFSNLFQFSILYSYPITRRGPGRSWGAKNKKENSSKIAQEGKTFIRRLVMHEDSFHSSTASRQCWNSLHQVIFFSNLHIHWTFLSFKLSNSMNFNRKKFFFHQQKRSSWNRKQLPWGGISMSWWIFTRPTTEKNEIIIDAAVRIEKCNQSYLSSSTVVRHEANL